MAQQNNNTVLEMGANDQAVYSRKPKKSVTYVIGGVAMVITIAVVVTLVVLLSGNEGASIAEPVVSTEGPTTPLYSSTTTTTVAPVTEAPTTTPAPVTDPPETEAPTQPIALEDVISGVYSASSFNATWSGGSNVLLKNSNGDLILYDVDTNSTTMLVQNSSEILQQSTRVQSLSPDRSYAVLSYNVLPVYRYTFLARYSAINVVSQEVVEITPPGVNADQAYLQNFVWGPAGTSCAFVYLNNIYYKSNLTAEPQQITTTGQLNIVYNGIPDWVYEVFHQLALEQRGGVCSNPSSHQGGGQTQLVEEVFSSSNAMWFSDDGSKLAYVTFDDSAVRIMRVPHYGVAGSVEYQYTQHHEIRYPKPGTTNPTVSVTLLNLEDNTNNVFNAPSNLLEPILTVVTFVTNESVALTWTNRVQNNYIVQICDNSATNNCQEIFSYSEPNGWIDNNPLIFNEAGNAFITILPQNVNGVLYKQVVQVSESTGGGLWTVTNRINTAHTVVDILKWTTNDFIWYKAPSVNDTAEQHIFRVDSSGFVNCFTCNIVKPDGGECLYNDATINEEGTRIAINCAGPDVPQTLIYTELGLLVSEWETNADLLSLVAEHRLPSTIRLSVPVADGFPDAEVQIQVPDDYQSRTDVPLLVYVYGGPDTSLVSKQWSVDWGTSLVNRWGIAVAHIDGRGSGLKGVDNLFTINRRLGTAEIEDQINVTRYLQENLSWLDANRTCIWGWSYGGYAASLALARGGDVFQCGIAVAPVVDWKYYDTIYTERYMDIPANNTEGYSESSLLTEQVANAYRDKRYFLVHGTADDNVHYQHAMLISRLLQTRDVYFTQMSYTDEDHGIVGVRPHLYHALEKYLQDNML